MRLLRTIFDFYLNSSIHVALSVYALTYITLLEFQLSYDENMLYFIFFSSITGYNFVKYFGLAKFHHRRLAGPLKNIQAFSLLCFFVLLFYLFKLETKTLVYIGVFALITFLYARPVLPNLVLDEKKNLRSISGVKVYVIALVWAGVTVLLPLVNQGYALSDDVIVTLVQHFIFVVVLMLPFEIRDLSYDSIKLATIPQRIGITKTILLGVVLLLLFFLLEFFKDEITPTVLWSNLVIVLVTMCCLVVSMRVTSHYFTAFWVEAIPVFWLVLMLFF